MKLRRLRMEMRSLNYQDWLLVCFILGVVGGTAAAHFFGGQTVKAQVLGGMGPGSSVDVAVRQALFWQVLRLRFAQLAVGWLMGLTVYSAVLFGLAAVWGGVTVAVVMSVLTSQKGLLGLPAFLCSLAPQGVCYALAWAVLAMWAGKQEKKIRLAPFGLLLLVGALGTFLEVYASPALYGLWF